MAKTIEQLQAERTQVEASFRQIQEVTKREQEKFRRGETTARNVERKERDLDKADTRMTLNLRSIDKQINDLKIIAGGGDIRRQVEQGQG